jgi:hypothetical protein
MVRYCGRAVVGILRSPVREVFKKKVGSPSLLDCGCECDLVEQLKRLVASAIVATILGRSQHPSTLWNQSGGI